MDDALLASQDAELRGEMAQRGQLSLVCDCLCRHLTSSSHHVPESKDAATALRNACAHEGNVRYLLGLNVLVNVQCFLQTFEVEEVDQVAVSAVVVLLCQMVANMTACGAESSVHIWAVHRSELFRDMVAAASKLGSRKAFAATLAAIYNGLCSVPNLAVQFAESRGLLCQVLLTAIVSAQTDDPALEWLHRIVTKCIERQVLVTIFARLDSRHPVTNATVTAPRSVWDDEAAPSLETGATHEQVIWLQAVQAVLEDGLITATLFAPGGDVWMLLHTLSQRLARMLGMVQQQEWEQQKQYTRDEKDAAEEQLRRHLLETGVLSMLGTISAGLAAVTADGSHAAAAAAEQGQGHALQQSLAATTEIIPTCVSLLEKIKPSSQTPPPRESATAATSSSSAASAFSKEVENEIVKAALALLGNLAYRCPTAQDAFRCRGGFVVVLPRCATSFSNPLEREWAHVCMRNVLEDNPASIAYVESLQPQGVHSTVAGLDLEIDPARGVFRFRGTGPRSSGGL